MKKLSGILVALIIALCSVSPAFAYDEAMPYLIDDAQCLTESQYNELDKALRDMNKAHNFDAVIVTVESVGDSTMQDFADDLYDYSGYSQDGGCLLLVATDPNERYISTTGFGIKAITDDGIGYLGDQLRDDFDSQDYYEAFKKFIPLMDDFLTQAETGVAYDGGNMPMHFEFYHLLIGLAIGAIIAGIVLAILKGQLKSVAKKTEANDYLQQDSLVITGQSDRFITSTVSKSAKSDSSSSGGGSSTHTSSSGSTHGGGSL